MSMVCEICQRRYPAGALVCHFDGQILSTDPHIGATLLGHEVRALLRPHPLGALYEASGPEGEPRLLACYTRSQPGADPQRWLMDCAQIATLRGHPHLPTLRQWRDAAQSDRGGLAHPAALFDVVAGQSLRPGQQLSLERLLFLGAQAAQALAALHTLKLVHGGLCPQVWAVGPSDHLTLLDAALYHLGQPDEAAEDHAAPYRDPQRDPGPPRAADDLYAFGRILAHLAQDHPAPAAFAGAAEALPRSARPEGPPHALSALIEQLCDPDPILRPSAHTLAQRLRTLHRPAPYLVGPSDAPPSAPAPSDSTAPAASTEAAPAHAPAATADPAEAAPTAPAHTAEAQAAATTDDSGAPAPSDAAAPAPGDAPTAPTPEAILDAAEGDEAPALAPPQSLGRAFPAADDQSSSDRRTGERMLFGRGFTAESRIVLPSEPGEELRTASLDLRPAGLDGPGGGQGITQLLVTAGLLTLLLLAGTVAWLVGRNALPQKTGALSGSVPADSSSSILRVVALPQGGQLGLEEALERVRPGQVIRLSAGLYRPITVSGPLVLEADPEAESPPLIEGDLPTLTVRSGEVTVRGLHFRHRGTIGHAVQVNDGHLILEAADISSVHGNGARARGQAQLTLRDSTIHHTGKGAVWAIEDAKVHIERAILSHTQYSAVELSQNAQLTIRRSLIHNSEAAGIFVSGQVQAVITDNEISEYARSGIEFADRATGRVARNRLHHGQGTGLLLRGQAVEIRVMDNEIHHNTWVGIEVSGNAAPEVWFNRLHDGKGAGILVHDGARGMYARNRIDGQLLSGIEVRGAQSRAVLVGNFIRDGKRAGIYVHDQAQAILIDNEVVANGLAGVEVSQRATIQARGNAIRTNRQAGVFFHSGGTGDLSQNDIEANAYAGVEIRDRAEPIQLTGNRIRLNRSHGLYLHLGGRAVARDNLVAGNRDQPYQLSEEGGSRLDWRENRTSEE